MTEQLELDLAGSHTDATTAFREWMLGLPPTPWAAVGDLGPVGSIIPRVLADALEAGQSHGPG